MQDGYCECGCGEKTKSIGKTSKKQNRRKGAFNRFVMGHNVGKQLNGEEIKEVITHYNSGSKIKEIAHIFECGYGTIQRLLISCGVGLRARNSFKKGNKPSSGLMERLKNKTGTRNPQWKGEKVGCVGLHEWVRNHKPKPKFCERCKSVSPYELANISGKYLRDVKDYEWLCRRCHMKDDGRLDKLRASYMFLSIKKRNSLRRSK